MHKKGFGQAYCTYLLKRIPTKFTLYFSEFYTIYYEFLKFKGIMEFENFGKQNLGKEKLMNSNGPKPAYGLGLPAWPSSQSGLAEA
jgi:hypothetical protein